MNEEEIEISISKEAVSQLPTEEFNGECIIIDTISKVTPAIAYLNRHKLVGFDTETRPSFKKGIHYNISLIQISTDSVCFLFRINKIGMPEKLLKFLNSKKTKKIGLSLENDFGMINKVKEIDQSGYIDIQKLAPQYHIKDASLQRIYAILFDKRISKSQRLTNWEAQQLTPAQCRYASLDAWSCLKIYNFLKSGEFIPSKSKYIIEPQSADKAIEEK